MKKVGKRLLSICGVIVVVLFCAQLFMISGSKSQPFGNDTNQRVHRSTTPTLLIPGWGGGTPSYRKMIHVYQDQHIAQKTMTIWVFPSGKTMVRGHLDHHTPNQLIQLLYVWNYSSTYGPQTKQLTAVLTMLHQRYHVNKLNIIAHSYGGSEWANAVLRSTKLQRQIQYRRVVLLGVPVDETFGTKTRFGFHLVHRSKDENFKQLLQGADKMKENHNQPVIINLMGSKTGRTTWTDGAVPHIQSEMMRVLVKRIDCPYYEHVYPNTTHFQLHQKGKIIDDVAHDIWGY